MRNSCVLAFAIVAFSSGAWAAPSSSGWSATLVSKAKTAFADITRAKTALNAGKTKTSDSYLAKSETLLKSVLAKSSTSGATSQAAQGGNAVSQAEGDAAKLDPSLASKFGIGKEQPAQENADAGTNARPQGAGAPAGNDLVAEIESAYQKVTLARTLLKAGNNSQAKSLLDEIPASPLSLLKGL
jgi:hypothetical protein